MRRNKEVESIKIQSFITKEDGDLEIQDTNLEVMVDTGPFAVAAMLKGLHEYFLTPAGAFLFEEDVKKVNQNLDVWKARAGEMLKEAIAQAELQAAQEKAPVEPAAPEQPAEAAQ